jgi:hypothetical protein
MIFCYCFYSQALSFIFNHKLEENIARCLERLERIISLFCFLCFSFEQSKVGICLALASSIGKVPE